MSDTDDEIRTLLRQMADDEEFEPVPLVPLMTRGRRGLLRRRVFSAVVAGAAVAAIVMAAATLPNLAVRQEPPAAASTRLAGTAPGDAALEPVSMTEALRRCRLQWTAISGRDVGTITMWKPSNASQVVGQVQPGRVKTVVDSQMQTFSCLVPGDYDPPAAELAVASRDSALPTDDAGLLRRCSTSFWHDLTGWRVVARKVDANTLAQAVAISPSQRYVAHCTVGGPAVREAVFNEPAERPAIESVLVNQSTMKDPRTFAASALAGMVFGIQAGSGCAAGARSPCSSWVFYGSGRTSAQVARMQLQTGAKVESIEVTDGWFAVAFELAVTDRSGRPGKIGPLTAFDSKGVPISAVTYISVLTG
ncbi:hypothetical protein OG394_28695 [Kribbella sp. NBC_01245]|uniref:hypothetical protein n=1 Tax=Kribbella sp. NBC_01245 TaxID=2903578 RepID=UPI002E2B3429|nr:hypothetical protein [Kribbella sp. NBC_01245]